LGLQLHPHDYQQRLRPSIIDPKTALITCAAATIDRFAPTLACKPELGTCKAPAIDHMSPPIDRAARADARVGTTITCLAETIDGNAAMMDRSSRDDDSNSLLGTRMRPLITGKLRLITGKLRLITGKLRLITGKRLLITGSARSVDYKSETIAGNVARGVSNLAMITGSDATVDDNAAMITR
jgi:hypothetical protein